MADGSCTDRPAMGEANEEEFAGKVALVTGTSGIARAAALRLAKAVASVFACGIDAAANAEAEQEAVGLPIRIGRTDVSASEDVAAAVEAAVSTFGGLDVIVNSAA